jgi:hypothetical protein
MKRTIAPNGEYITHTRCKKQTSLLIYDNKDKCWWWWCDVCGDPIKKFLHSEFREVIMTDHHFARFLLEKDREWKHSSNHVTGINYFYAKGELVATTLNNNALSTRRIFVKESLLEEAENVARLNL